MASERVADLLEERIDGEIESVAWYNSRQGTHYGLVTALRGNGTVALTTVILDTGDETLRIHADNSMWLPAEPDTLDVAIRSLARASNAATGSIDDVDPMTESLLEFSAEEIGDHEISDDYEPGDDDEPWQASSGPEEMGEVHSLLEESPIETADRLIRLEFGRKDPWSGEAQRVMRGPDEIGGNYGVEVDADDDLVILDVDDLEAAPVDEMSESLRSESPHGGEHRFYHVPGWRETFKDRFGVENPHGTWGEVRAGDGYVVGPGSELTECKHGCCTESDPGEYVLDSAPIATVDAEELADLIATGRGDA